MHKKHSRSSCQEEVYHNDPTFWRKSLQSEADAQRCQSHGTHISYAQACCQCRQCSSGVSATDVLYTFRSPRPWFCRRSRSFADLRTSPQHSVGRRRRLGFSVERLGGLVAEFDGLSKCVECRRSASSPHKQHSNYEMKPYVLTLSHA